MLLPTDVSVRSFKFRPFKFTTSSICQITKFLLFETIILIADEFFCNDRSLFVTWRRTPNAAFRKRFCCKRRKIMINEMVAREGLKRTIVFETIYSNYGPGLSW